MSEIFLLCNEGWQQGKCWIFIDIKVLIQLNVFILINVLYLIIEKLYLIMVLQFFIIFSEVWVFLGIQKCL